MTATVEPFPGTLNRRLPHNVEAEIVVLGAILLEDGRPLAAIPWLRPEHFILEPHRAIFAEMLRMRDAGDVTNPITMRTWAAAPAQEAVLAPAGGTPGGKALLHWLADRAVTDAVPYARAVAEDAHRRELIAHGEQVVAGAYNCQPVADLLADATAGIEAIRAAVPRGNDIAGIATWAAARTRAKADIPEPQRYLGPLIYEGSRLYLTGGTGVGKSGVGFGIAKALLTHKPFAWYQPSGVTVRVLFLDYEMGRAVIKERLKETGLGDIEGFYVISFDDPELGDDGLLPIDTDAGQAQVKAIIAALGAHVVMIDNLYSAVIGGIVGGSEKNGAHDKVVPFLKSLSKDGIASVLFHHSGHDKTRAYGDDKYAWQMTAHWQCEAVEGARDGELKVKITEKKLRGVGKHIEPIVIAYEGGGSWSAVEKTSQAADLSDRQQWLVAQAFECINKGMYVDGRDYPVAYVTTLRDAYKKRFFVHEPEGNGARQGWARDTKMCAQFFTVEAMYIYRTKKPSA